nr:MAG TPA: hypothetical protein [Caudoviricetes sp.]
MKFEFYENFDYNKINSGTFLLYFVANLHTYLWRR